MANCEKLQLRFEDEQDLLGQDAHVLKVVLYEGLSFFYHSTVSVLSTKLFTPKELASKLYGHKVCLSLYQSQEQDEDVASNSAADVPSQARYRCLCGQIRAAQFLGQIKTKGAGEEGAAGAEVCIYNHYELTLVSPLAAMQDHHHIRSWPQSSVLEVLKSLCQEYGVTLQVQGIEGSTVTASPSDKQVSVSAVLNSYTQQLWVQNGESDAQFLQRLLCLHGLNLCFVHAADAFAPQVYLCYGNNFPTLQLYQESGLNGDVDSAQEIATQNASLNSRKDVLLISDFKCGTAPTHNLSTASELLAAYPALMPQLSAVISDDYQFQHSDTYKSLVTQCLDGYLQLQQQAVQGSAHDLALQPSVPLTVTDFGSSGLKLIITQTVTTAIAPLPATISLPKAMDDALGAVSGTGSAADSAKELAAGTPTEWGAAAAGAHRTHRRQIAVRMQLKEWGEAAYAGALVLPELVHGGSAACQVHSATVCNAAGKTTLTAQELATYGELGNLTAVDSSAQPTIFYALLPHSDKPVLFSCQQGGLSAHGGLCQYPRVGDKVLLLQNAQGFFFLGFDQNSTASHSAAHNDLSFDSYRAHQLQQSLSLEHVPQIAEAETDNQGKVKTADVVSSTKRSRLSFDNFASAADCVAYLCYYGSLEPIWRALASQYNNPALNQAYQDYGKALLMAAENIKAKHLDLLLNPPAKEDLQTKQSALKGDIDAFYEKIDELLVKSCQALGVSSKDEDNKLFTTLQQMRFSLVVEKGNLLVSAAQGTTMVNGKSINIAATEAINLNAPSITINADSKVNIAVAGNAIGVTLNGISLESRKWTGTKGMLDAFVFLDAINGVNISGLDIIMNACFSALLQDSFGAMVKLNNGSVNVNGINVAMSTTTKAATIKKVTDFTVQSVIELADMITTLAGGKTYNITKSLSYLLPSADSATTFVTQSYNSWKKNEVMPAGAQRDTWVMVAELINGIIMQLTTITQTVLVTNYSAVLSMPLPLTPKYTVRDLLRTILLFNKITTIVLALVEIFAVQSTTKAASLVLNSKANLKAEAVTNTILIGNAEVAAAPTAAVDTMSDKAAQVTNVLPPTLAIFGSFLMPLAPKADSPYSTGDGGGSGSSSTGQGEQPDDSQDEQADDPEAEPQS